MEMKLNLDKANKESIISSLKDSTHGDEIGHHLLN